MQLDVAEAMKQKGNSQLDSQRQGSRREFASSIRMGESDGRVIHRNALSRARHAEAAEAWAHKWSCQFDLDRRVIKPVGMSTPSRARSSETAEARTQKWTCHPGFKNASSRDRGKTEERLDWHNRQGL